MSEKERQSYLGFAASNSSGGHELKALKICEH